MNSPPINFRHLRAFYEVGLSGRVSPVAENLFMSQPAVSQALAKFENRCAAQLFYRRSSGLDLTEAGHLIHARAGRALNFLDVATQQVTSRQHDGLRLSRQITTTQLRALVAVADHESFTTGARIIGTSQPAISRAIRDLEKLCDRKLVEKTGRGIVLTNAAEIIAQAARLSFEELRQGEDEIKALRGADTSVLTIGSLPLARSAVLPKAMLAFAAENPDVAIHVIDGPYDDILTGLRRGEIDILIGALRSTASSDDVIETPLFDDQLSIVARADHPITNLKTVSPNDLLQFPWIVPRSHTPTRDYFNRFMADVRMGETPHLIEASSLILIRGLLVESDSLAMISAQQVAFELDTGALVRIDYELRGSQRPIGLTCRREWHPTRTQTRFLNEINKAAAAIGLVSGGDI